MKAEIRKLLGSDKLIIGTDRCMKLLRSGDLKKVILASNAKQQLVEDVQRFDVEVERLDIPNEELGVYCKKPFNISILGIKQ